MRLALVNSGLHARLFVEASCRPPHQQRFLSAARSILEQGHSPQCVGVIEQVRVRTAAINLQDVGVNRLRLDIVLLLAEHIGDVAHCMDPGQLISQVIFDSSGAAITVQRRRRSLEVALGLSQGFQRPGQQFSVGTPAALGNSLGEQVPRIVKASFAASLVTKRQKWFWIKHWVQITMHTEYTALPVSCPSSPQAEFAL